MAVPENLKNIVEAALLAAGGALSLDTLQSLFGEEELPEKKRLREILNELTEDYQGRGLEVREVASGWRIQVVEEVSPWISRLWSERPARYSRALMETLALIAYRQPITRGEIEDIRGVSVSTHIVKTLLEREWIRVVGHRDVPGKPSLYGTTREFLDYFNLCSLDELPTLAEIRDLDEINRELELEDPDRPEASAGGEGETDGDDEATARREEETGESMGESDGEPVASVGEALDPTPGDEVDPAVERQTATEEATPDA